MMHKENVRMIREGQEHSDHYECTNVGLIKSEIESGSCRWVYGYKECIYQGMVYSIIYDEVNDTAEFIERGKEVPNDNNENWW